MLILLAAAKAATVHLTKLMSAEFQKAYIRVNSIAPGYFPSEMVNLHPTRIFFLDRLTQLADRQEQAVRREPEV